MGRVWYGFGLLHRYAEGSNPFRSTFYFYYERTLYMQKLTWVKSTANEWLNFQTFNLSNDHGQGVYIIWHAGNPSRVVYVGQGDIAARLRSHRNNADITYYSKYGTLKVTWASVSSHQLDGVEHYLANTWNPLVGDAHPDAYPIAVNSPW